MARSSPLATRHRVHREPLMMICASRSRGYFVHMYRLIHVTRNVKYD